MDKEQFDKLVENLNTQDNRATSYPMFQVQQIHQINGMDPGFHDPGDDNYYWIDSITESIFGNDEDLKEEYFADEEVDFEQDVLQIDGHRFEKVYYIEIWEFVTAHFTEKAAQNYIDNNRHNLKNPRIYVSSQYRCDEWNTVVKAIKNGELVLKEG